MKEIDDTPVPESESELSVIELLQWQDAVLSVLKRKVEALEVEVADLHHRRRVSRQQAVDQDPEWY